MIMNKDTLKPVGYGALLDRYRQNPIPHYSVSFVARKGDRKTIVDPDLTTEIYPSRYDPGDTPGDHLEFALKYEGVNLEILKGVFAAADESELTAFDTMLPPQPGVSGIESTITSGVMRPSVRSCVEPTSSQSTNPASPMTGRMCFSIGTRKIC